MIPTCWQGGTLPARLVLLGSLTLAGCGDDPALPSQPDATREPPEDSNTDSLLDAGPDTREGGGGECQAPEGTGDRFADLYRDIIADTETSAARCQTGSCHGGPPGMAGLRMFTSATSGTTATRDDAYRAITTYVPKSFVPLACKTDPKPACCATPTDPTSGCALVRVGGKSADESSILLVLDPKTGLMPMPLPCNRKLLPSELARVRSWLERGAPNDG